MDFNDVFDGWNGKNAFWIKNREELSFILSNISAFHFGDYRKICIKVDFDNYVDEDIESLQILADKCNEIFNDVCFEVQAKDSKLTIGDLEKFIDFEENLKRSNSKLYFTEGNHGDYSLSEIINAQEQIENFAQKIKNIDASPLEKFLLIYNFLIKKKYHDGDCWGDDNTFKAREIIGVLNSDYIVCVGYAAMLKRLCDEVGIICFKQVSEVYENGEYVGGHANNLVKITDEKYGIDGLFYVDATWDSVRENAEDKLCYARCLIPVQDATKMKDLNLVFEGWPSILYNYTNCDSLLCLQGINSCENNIDDFCKNHPEMFQSNVDDTGLCNDKNRFINACRKVKELLLANSISPDYFYNRRVPNISHISRLFALFMYDEVDDKRLAESVEALREFKVEDKDKGDYKWQCSEDLLFDQNDNIYSILDQLLEDISSDELESDLCSYCTVKRFIQDIKESRQQILLERQIKEYIIKFDKTIKYCDKDSFAKALRRTYELEGLDESIIDAKVEESMEESTKRANNCFMNTAANFFVNDMNLQNVEN